MMEKFCLMKFISRVKILFVLITFLGFAVTAATSEETAPAKKKAAPVTKTVPAEEGSKPAPQKVDPKDPRSMIYMDSRGQLAGTGDPSKTGPASEVIKTGAGWHPAALAGTAIPKDRYGLVDWVKAVKENIITPVHSLEPKVEDEAPMDMDVTIESKSDFVNDVVYPHWIHTFWFSCDVCHPKIFIMAAGQNNMTMTGIAEGKWCGRCHGKVAFPLTDCKRCHVKPKAGAAQKK